MKKCCGERDLDLELEEVYDVYILPPNVKRRRFTLPLKFQKFGQFSFQNTSTKPPSINRPTHLPHPNQFPSISEAQPN